jgi:hypothetical protein
MCAVLPVTGHGSDSTGFPGAEFCYNTSFQSSIRTSLFQVVSSRAPLSIRSFSLGEACVPAVQAQMQHRDEFL